jgi:hypothetical protein
LVFQSSISFTRRHLATTSTADSRAGIRVLAALGEVFRNAFNVEELYAHGQAGHLDKATFFCVF